ncbi:MAG: hypothetical protein ABUL77_03105 [Bacteroidota bacterium]
MSAHAFDPTHSRDSIAAIAASDATVPRAPKSGGSPADVRAVTRNLGTVAANGNELEPDWAAAIDAATD